jgi:hypothetical protein
MPQIKLLACLVTLQFTCGLTLQAADPQDFRPWTDAGGRTITARLIDTPTAESAKIEREDGRVFTVDLKTFSVADQAYVKALAVAKAARPRLPDGFKLADAALWTLLETGGQQPASTYSNTVLDLVLENINQRCAVREVKTPAGQLLHIRTEPADLASHIKLSGEMPRMSMTGFIKELARANNLAVATDLAGLVVLVDQTSPGDKSPDEFLGVKFNN